MRLTGALGESGIVYEFDGCWWHGHVLEENCSCKKRNGSYTGELKECLAERRKFTELRNEEHETAGYGVKLMKECEWKFLKSCKGELPNEIVTRGLPPLSRHYGYDNVPSVLKMEGGFQEALLGGHFFGFAEVDIEVPEEKYDKFKEFSPIFVTSEVTEDDMTEAVKANMRDHIAKMVKSQDAYDIMTEEDKKNIKIPPRTQLVGCMKAEEILLSSELLKFLLEEGLVITKLHQVMEFQPKKAFKKFADHCTDMRRASDKDPDKKKQADHWKLVSNSAYGGTMLDKDKQTDVGYYYGRVSVCKEINDRHFIKLKDVGGSLYEVEKKKKRVKKDVPIHIGFQILQYAKLILLSFYYRFIDVYIERRDYELLYMDTDSLHLSFSERVIPDKYGVETLRKLVKPDLREQFEEDVANWMVTSPEDRRTPGLFKLEFVGDNFVALCSKTYHTTNSELFKSCFAGCKTLSEVKESEYKLSSKGIQTGAHPQQTAKAFESYKHALRGEKMDYTYTNTGIKTDVVSNRVVMYSQQRDSITNLYTKRRILGDGCHTEPITRAFYCGIGQRDQDVRLPDDDEMNAAMSV